MAALSGFFSLFLFSTPIMIFLWYDQKHNPDDFYSGTKNLLPQDLLVDFSPMTFELIECLSYSTHYFALKNFVYLVRGQKGIEMEILFFFFFRKKLCCSDHPMKQVIIIKKKRQNCPLPPKTIITIFQMSLTLCDLHHQLWITKTKWWIAGMISLQTNHQLSITCPNYSPNIYRVRK